MYVYKVELGNKTHKELTEILDPSIVDYNQSLLYRYATVIFSNTVKPLYNEVKILNLTNTVTDIEIDNVKYKAFGISSGAVYNRKFVIIYNDNEYYICNYSSNDNELDSLLRKNDIAVTGYSKPVGYNVTTAQWRDIFKQDKEK